MELTQSLVVHIQHTKSKYSAAKSTVTKWMQQSSSLSTQQVISQFDSSPYQHIIEKIFLKKYLFIYF